MLGVSYRVEVRPEAEDRVDEVFEAQRDRLERMYDEVLRHHARQGELEELAAGRYRLVRTPGRAARLKNRLYFLRSKLRATGRWLKHVVTFDDWLDYIVRKVERRTGRTVELTERERKWPLIFLWPRVFRVLRELPGSAGEAGEDDEEGEEEREEAGEDDHEYDHEEDA